MTDEQINRTIAESLCPSKGDDVCIICGWALQGLKWYEHCGPPDFIKNPAMRDLLQAKLLEEGWKVVMMSKLSSNEFCLDLRRMGKQAYASGTRERIWALAFIRAHNLDPNGRKE